MAHDASDAIGLRLLLYLQVDLVMEAFAVGLEWRVGANHSGF